MGNAITNMFASMFSSFMGVLLIYFMIANPRGWKGRSLVKKIKKHELTEGKDYFPDYFHEDDAILYAFEVVIRTGLMFFGLVSGLMGLFYILPAILGVFLIAINYKPLQKKKKETLAKFIEKFGEKEGKRIHDLFYTVGMGTVIRVGWGIILLTVIVGFVILGLTIHDTTNQYEYEYEDDLEYYYRNK